MSSIGRLRKVDARRTASLGIPSIFAKTWGISPGSPKASAVLCKAVMSKKALARVLIYTGNI